VVGLIDILHLYWIVPLSMCVGAITILCIFLMLALAIKRDEQIERERAIAADCRKI
jgi:hypothetical protein